MSARKHRVPVVLDTNVFVRSFKSRSKSSPNRRIVRLWLIERKIQLIVSDEVVDEYLEIFDNLLAMDKETVAQWQERSTDSPRVTVVKLGRRDQASRDPDDNVFLSTSRAGRAKYLVTNDRDLLDLPESAIKALPFSIVKPHEFLRAIEQE
jgi:putative PIN family toxin of toxin-antitoxin system